jgi:hypothetical protein
LSSNEQAPWRSTANGLIAKEKYAEIFLLRDDHQFHLPFVEMEGEKWENGAAKAQASVRAGAKFQRLLGGNLNLKEEPNRTLSWRCWNQ